MSGKHVFVCNGAQFIEAQLKHIYSMVDEIVIIEGADAIFQKVIGSRRSNDGTVKIVKNFADPDKKIKLENVSRNKNAMVRRGNVLCSGDLIYQVDVDEFLRHSVIDEAFDALSKHDTVMVPQRLYFK